MDDNTLRIGIIGIGLYATIAHVPQVRATDKAEVVAICRRNPDKLAVSQKQLGVSEAYTDWREMLETSRLDAVVISTPHNSHAEQTIEALDRGLHVLVEKPMALTKRNAQAMIDAAERANRILMVGYNRRFEGLWRTAQVALAENAIGVIRQVSLQFALHRRWYWEEQQIPSDILAMLKEATSWPDEFFEDVEKGEDWHADPAASGGGMFSNSGSHLVDLVLWLAGAPPVQVVAFGDSLGFPTECLLCIQAQLKNGVQVSIASADVPAGGFGGQGRLTVVGDNGILTHDFSQPTEIWLHRDGESEKVVSTFPNTSVAESFVDSITMGSPVLCSGHEAIGAVSLTESAYRSATEGRIVAIG